MNWQVVYRTIDNIHDLAGQIDDARIDNPPATLVTLTFYLYEETDNIDHCYIWPDGVCVDTSLEVAYR